MRTTINNINKALKEKTGLDVKLWRGNGYFYFYSDDSETGLMLAGFESTSVYTCQLGIQSVSGWVEDFEFMLKKFNESKSLSNY